MTDAWRNGLAGLLLLGSLLVVYHSSFSSDFVWDDRFLVLDDAPVRIEAGVSSVFTRPFGPVDRGKHSGYYRPVTTISYLGNYWMSGEDAFVYRITNLVLHALVGVFVLMLVTILSGSYLTSVSAALLFVLHPAHVGSVAWVSGRTDVLCAFFMVAGLVAYVSLKDSERRRARWLALLLFGLSMGSKELGCLFPLAMLLVDLGVARWDFPKAIRELDRPFYAASFVFAAAFVAVHHVVTGGVGASNDVAEWSHRLPSALVNLATYLRILFVPWNLQGFYFPVPDGGHIALAASVVAAGVAAIIVFRRHTLILFGALWCLLTLLPVIGLIPISSTYRAADHVTYLSSLGAVLVGLGLLHLLVDLVKSQRVGSGLHIIVVFTVALFFGLETGTNAPRWRGEVELFSELARTSGSGGTFALLGDALMRNGEWEDAEKAFENGLSLDATHGDLWYGLSEVAVHRGSYERAKDLLLEAERHSPNSASIQNNLGNLFLLEGAFAQARSHYERSLKLDPFNYEAMYNAALACRSLRDLRGARQYLKRFIETAPPSFDQQKEGARRMLGPP